MSGGQWRGSCRGCYAAIVQSGAYEGVDECFGSGDAEGGTETCNVC